MDQKKAIVAVVDEFVIRSAQGCSAGMDIEAVARFRMVEWWWVSVITNSAVRIPDPQAFKLDETSGLRMVLKMVL
jgi:hypothetical protein